MLKISIEQTCERVPLSTLGVKSVFIHPSEKGTYVKMSINSWEVMTAGGGCTNDRCAAFELTGCGMYMFQDTDLVTLVGHLRCKASL